MSARKRRRSDPETKEVSLLPKAKRARVARAAPVPEFIWNGLAFPRPGVVRYEYQRVCPDGIIRLVKWRRYKRATRRSEEGFEEVPGPSVGFYRDSGRLQRYDGTLYPEYKVQGAFITYADTPEQKINTYEYYLENHRRWGVCMKPDDREWGTPFELRAFAHASDVNLIYTSLLSSPGRAEWARFEAAFWRAIQKAMGCAKPVAGIVIDYLWLDWRALLVERAGVSKETLKAENLIA